MLLGTLGASLSGNHLIGRGAIAKREGRRTFRAGKGKGINRAGERIVRAGYGRPSSSAPHNNIMDF